MIKLDNRLRAVVDNISGKCLADIGCDHGKVSCMALIEKRVERVVASDISLPSLNKAKELACQYGLDSIEFKHCGGFDDYEDGLADVVVIAGMGGKEIVEILAGKPNGVEKLVLVAHKDVDKVRQYVTQNGYKLDKDFVVKAGRKFYNILVATYGKEQLDYHDIMLGKNHLQDEVYIQFVNAEIEKCNKIVQSVGKDKNHDIQQYLQLLTSEKEKM